MHCDWLPFRWHYVVVVLLLLFVWSDAAPGGESRYWIPVQPACQWLGHWPRHFTLHLGTFALVTLHQIVFHRSVRHCRHNWPASLITGPNLLNVFWSVPQMYTLNTTFTTTTTTNINSDEACLCPSWLFKMTYFSSLTIYRWLFVVPVLVQVWACPKRSVWTSQMIMWWRMPIAGRNPGPVTTTNTATTSPVHPSTCLCYCVGLLSLFSRLSGCLRVYLSVFLFRCQ